MEFRRYAIGIIAGLAFAAVRAEEAGGAPGRQAADSRVDIHEVSAPAEVRPAIAFPRPSGVTHAVAPNLVAPAVASAVASCAPEVRGADESNVPFRITIDGEPAGGAEKTIEADRQRCTDIALQKADIQVRYDSLAIAPAMNVWATPNGAVKGQAVEFRAWSNYIPWVTKAELRIFRADRQPQETPLAVLPMDWNEAQRWTPPVNDGDRLFYLLRVYDAAGRFDETSLKPLTLLTRARPPGDGDMIGRERLTGYGENSLVLRNIPVTGGTVTVNGSHLKPGQRVATLGLSIPVDPTGGFAIKQILPAGPHTVEVTVADPDGRATTFRRNLTIARDDWFFVALGDLTVGQNQVSGPARLVTDDTQHYDGKVYVDGRAAFYLKGKIKGEWLLTAAADTREQPLKDLFSNFSSKDPRYLLRNINPDLYYPVYGDDSTTVDDAPTQGKFYVRLEQGDSQIMWGNFQTSWSGTELLQFSRGLYGAKGRYRSPETTPWGEQRTRIDAFSAQPGTVSSREEFRGTGGSLYYLRHLDITQGSERVWVEVRDRDSGLVIERRQLTPAQDYEINNIQGRILLRETLPATASGGGLVMTSSMNGQPLYLVITYEYAPGVAAIENFASGGRASHWLTDYLQLGLTGYRQNETGADQTLQGADATLRYAPGTWLKVETARSTGSGNGSLTSQDGGFNFYGQNSAGQTALAYRVEAAVDLAEVTAGGKGKIAAYSQDRERGFSAPGQVTVYGEAVRQQGARASVEVTPGTQLDVKADRRHAELRAAENVEVAVRQELGQEWQGSLGLRHDNQDNKVPNASPILSENGSRTDVLLRLDYLPSKAGGKPGEKEDWNAYGFVQDTLDRNGTRGANNRAGVGGAWRINDRIKVLTEISDGNLGTGGRVGAEYRLSDRSNAYLNYVLETESPDVAWRGRQGTWVSGSTTRFSDQLRGFGETRATHGAGPQSLAQAYGLDWAPNDRWTFGGKAEIGTVSDVQAGDLKRRALAVSVSYKEGDFKYSGAIELREDRDNISGKRNTLLVRNTLGVQATREWRLLGKLDVSRSNSSEGAFYDGNFHEIVAGAAYRPVTDDRWNALFKYTNLYNLPSPGQLGASGTTADYAQKSQVFAVDAIYDLKPWLSLGGKYAFRIGDLKPTRTNGDWFSSRADLLILRADLHWVKEWDAVVELRNLKGRESHDARAGALLAVYRHITEGVKLGLGYNFTDYSDDLTDLSYRSRGWFFNVLGTL